MSGRSGFEVVNDLKAIKKLPIKPNEENRFETNERRSTEVGTR